MKNTNEELEKKLQNNIVTKSPTFSPFSQPKSNLKTPTVEIPNSNINNQKKENSTKNSYKKPQSNYFGYRSTDSPL